MVDRNRKSQLGATVEAGHRAAFNVDDVAATLADHIPGSAQAVHFRSARPAMEQIGLLWLVFVIFSGQPVKLQQPFPILGGKMWQPTLAEC